MKKHKIILCIILIIGIILRLYKIWDFSFTHDELSAISRLSFDSFSNLIENGVKPDGHPAGIQVFLWIWTKIFGISEISIRFPFFLMGVLCIPLMYKLTKMWFNETSALFTSAMMAVSQYTIFYTLIARPYIAGLFFILIFLIVWTKLIFQKDYQWKNIILFGLLAAICAYIHYFSMLVAFLIAFIGLFLHFHESKKTTLRYIFACLLAIVLYLPHLPIFFHQLKLGGVGDWLPALNPEFIHRYFKYLFHFSWITILIVLLQWLCVCRINKAIWEKYKIKIGLSLFLFLAPFIIGYCYSVWINPVLQISTLIFSYPFLLLFFAAFIDEKLNKIAIFSLLFLSATMIFSLCLRREHYKMLSLQWYEKSVEKLIDIKQKYGEENVDCMLGIDNMTICTYYEKKYPIKINNQLVDFEINNNSFINKISSLQTNYLLVAGLTEDKLMIIRKFYPNLLEYIPCYTSEIYIFSKMGENKIATKHLYEKTENFDNEKSIDDEFILISELNLSALMHSRYIKVNAILNYITDTIPMDYEFVMETSHKGKIVDWRSTNPTDCFIKDGNICQVFMALRGEWFISDLTKNFSDYHVKLFLWNKKKNSQIKPISSSIVVSEGNPYVYGFIMDIH